MNEKNTHGFALIDKEKGMSSFFALKQLRKKLFHREVGKKYIKIGHAGTLDPIATGLLIVAFGEATKLLEYIVGYDKAYEATAVLGEATETYDAESTPFFVGSTKNISYELIKDKINDFLGTIEQLPPKFSAKKINGIPSYKLARQGLDVKIKKQKINVDSIEILSFKNPELKLKIKCGSGTYIRSLIHDIGMSLGCGAYMSELRRISIGENDIKNSVKIESFTGENVLPMEKLVNLRVIDFSDDLNKFELLNKGGFVEIEEKTSDERVFLGKFNGQVFAVLENCKENIGKIKVKKKLNVFV